MDTNSNILFQAFFEINDVDPHGKKFDRGEWELHGMGKEYREEG